MKPDDKMAATEARARRGGQVALFAAIALAGAAIAISLGRNSDQAPVGDAGAPGSPTAALEARIRENPADGEAWTALAGDHFEAGRFAGAATAFGKAIELAPGKAQLWAARGEALVMASERDPMPAAAAADFAKAIALDPKEPRARYFLAVKQDLAGDHKGAIDAWLALLADTPPGAVWEADLRRTIEQVGAINRIEVAKRLAAVRQPVPALPPAAQAIPGPSAADLEQARSLKPDEQRAMAEGMVARLESRLKTEPVNPEGWIMLMRSRKHLGEEEKASQALRDALAANPGKADFLRQQAEVLGVR